MQTTAEPRQILCFIASRKMMASLLSKEAEQWNTLSYILLTPNYFYKIYPVAFLTWATINVYKEITASKAAYTTDAFLFS